MAAANLEVCKIVQEKFCSGSETVYVTCFEHAYKDILWSESWSFLNDFVSPKQLLRILYPLQIATLKGNNQERYVSCINLWKRRVDSAKHIKPHSRTTACVERTTPTMQLFSTNPRNWQLGHVPTSGSTNSIGNCCWVIIFILLNERNLNEIDESSTAKNPDFNLTV